VTDTVTVTKKILSQADFRQLALFFDSSALVTLSNYECGIFQAQKGSAAEYAVSRSHLKNSRSQLGTRRTPMKKRSNRCRL
jgi:hypothetical protein